MNKLHQIETFMQNIIKYKDFFDINAFFENIPEDCILTQQDLESILHHGNQILVIGPDFYSHHEILSSEHPNIKTNAFYIYQGYAVTDNDSSYWYKINQQFSDYITTLNLEICNQLFEEQLM